MPSCARIREIEDVLRATGVRDFDHYSVKAGEPLMKDLFLDD
jgi:hypothetical protein